jgi:polysaccharide transporter, PST family
MNTLKLLPNFIRKKIEGKKELQKIIKNINWLTFERILKMFLAIFVSAWVARYLGPEQFGMMSYALAFVALFAVFNTLGLDGIVVRNIVKNPEKKQEYLGSTLLLKFLGSLLMLVLTTIGISILRPDNNLMIIFVIIISFGYLFKSFQVIDLWFQSQVKSKYAVYSRSISFIIISVLKVIFILTQKPLIAFILMFSLDSLIAAILLIYFYQKKGQISLFKWKARINTIKELLKDSWPLIFSGIAVAVYMRIDQIMIGNMMGDSALGIYSAAVRLSEMWYFLPVIITASVFPAIIRAKKKSEKLYQKRLQILYNSFTWFTISVALIITFLSPFIINLLYGADYALASTVLSIHIWAGVFVFLGVASSKHLIAENLTKISFYRTISGAIANIGLNIFLIPIYGIIGAAISTLLSYMISAFIMNLFFKKSRIIFIMQTKSLNAIKHFRYLKWKK